MMFRSIQIRIVLLLLFTTILINCSGGSSSDNSTTPVQNLAPTGSISHDNGNGSTGSTGDISITEGSSVVFNSSVSDPENDPISYAWDFQGSTPSSATTSGPITVTYSNAGTFTVSLIVSDDQGNSTTIPTSPLVVTVLATTSNLPAFKYLPLLTPTLINGVSTYTLDVEENINVTVESPDGSWITPMIRYNGLQLPPVIVAKRGDDIKVTVNNNLSQSNEDTTVHWHGFKIPGAEDGGPDFPIGAGTSRIYQFSLVQPAASLWFHPHADGTTATQVYKGLAGGFIVTDDITDTLVTNNEIPSGENDIALLIQDRQFEQDTNNTGIRNLVYQAGNGMLGDHILVNGVEMPALDVNTTQYRFRLYNGSNARTYDFTLDNGMSFFVIGTDGGLLNSPVSSNHIMLGAGERAEIVVDFQNLLNQQIKLISQAFDGGGMIMGGSGSLQNGDAFDVMLFNVSSQVTDLVTLYSSLPTVADINTRLTAVQSDLTRDFVMSASSGAGGGMQFLINGVTFDINRVDETIASGATEIWNISNTSNMAHPFHAHAIQWQILDRGPTGGNLTPAFGVDLGWKDTVLVQPGETVRFIGQFDPVVNVGLYMYHCHILEHEDSGMMGTFEVLQ